MHSVHSEALVCLLRAHTKLVHCAFGEYRRIRVVLGSKHTHLSFLVPSEKAVILCRFHLIISRALFRFNKIVGVGKFVPKSSDEQVRAKRLS